MPLVSSLPMIASAFGRGRAVLAFNVSSLEMAQGVVEAAEASGRPVVVQFNRAGLQHIGGVHVAASAIGALAGAASTPVALHLDHADTVAELHAAAAAGFTSLMIDGSTLPFAEHVALAREGRAVATSAGCPLEAELGHVAGTEAGVRIAAESLTDPEQAARFVTATGVEMLAVSIGNVHGRAPSSPSLDLVRLERIRAMTAIPLVLHGASGLAPTSIEAAVTRGVAKINVGTGVHSAFVAGLRSGLAGSDDGREVLAAARDAVRHYADALLRAPYALAGVD